jgi:cell wall-associated NlpC family hydrolase
MSEPFAQRVVRLALAKLGKPYIWGANGELTWAMPRPVPTLTHGVLEAYDCAGLVKDSVFDAMGPDVRWTWNAQQMWELLPAPTLGEPFVLRLYGHLPHVSHVAIDLGNGLVLEASGGDQTTTTYTEAARRGAKVRVGFEQRGDFLGKRSLSAMEYPHPPCPS